MQLRFAVVGAGIQLCLLVGVIEAHLGLLEGVVEALGGPSTLLGGIVQVQLGLLDGVVEAHLGLQHICYLSGTPVGIVAGYFKG